ncbi:MAG TPA: LysR family transcriptional regulator [Candidatus Binatia bacterium]
MDTLRFRVFLECARLKNFSRAAEILHMSQPSVSFHINQLEDWLGAPLFHRRGKRVELTEAGIYLKGQAQQLLSSIEGIRQGVHELLHIDRGRLAVAAGGPLGTHMLPRALGIFRGLHPEVEIHMRFGIAPEIEYWLNEDIIELGMFSRKPKSPGLAGEFYASSPMVAVASPRHPIASKRGLKLKDLLKEPLILREPEAAGGEVVRAFFAQRGLKVRKGMELSNHEAIKVAVAQGLGVTVMSKGLLWNEVALKTLKVLSVDDLDLSIDHWLAYRSGRKLSNAGAALRQFLQERKSELVKLLL